VAKKYGFLGNPISHISKRNQRKPRSKTRFNQKPQLPTFQKGIRGVDVIPGSAAGSGIRNWQGEYSFSGTPVSHISKRNQGENISQTSKIILSVGNDPRFPTQIIHVGEGAKGRKC
jgi:hypothetical protein